MQYLILIRSETTRSGPISDHMIRTRRTEQIVSDVWKKVWCYLIKGGGGHDLLDTCWCSHNFPGGTGASWQNLAQAARSGSFITHRQAHSGERWAHGGAGKHPLSPHVVPLRAGWLQVAWCLNGKWNLHLFLIRHHWQHGGRNTTGGGSDRGRYQRWPRPQESWCWLCHGKPFPLFLNISCFDWCLFVSAPFQKSSPLCQIHRCCSAAPRRAACVAPQLDRCYGFMDVWREITFLINKCWARTCSTPQAVFMPLLLFYTHQQTVESVWQKHSGLETLKVTP